VPNPEYSQAPGRCDSETQQEGNPDQVVCVCAFAPALEHGYGSNKEQQDRGAGEDFQQSCHLLRDVVILPNSVRSRSDSGH